jgi:selenocysteine lyase/cysteine desulfurase
MTLCKLVRKRLADTGLTVLDKGKDLGSIITVKIPGRGPDNVLQYLRAKNINTSVSRKSDALIDFTAKEVDWALRISPHYFNTPEEVDQLIDVLSEMLATERA